MKQENKKVAKARELPLKRAQSRSKQKLFNMSNEWLSKQQTNILTKNL